MGYKDSKAGKRTGSHFKMLFTISSQVISSFPDAFCLFVCLFESLLGVKEGRTSVYKPYGMAGYEMYLIQNPVWNRGFMLGHFRDGLYSSQNSSLHWVGCRILWVKMGCSDVKILCLSEGCW